MIIQKYKLNLVPGSEPVIVRASQYDNLTRVITFALFKDRDIFVVPDGCKVYVLGTKEDKTGYFYECTVEHNYVAFYIRQQMSVLPGKHEAEIRIVDEENHILNSANFIVDIEKAAFKDDTVISETDIPLLQMIINHIDSINAVEIMLSGGTTGQVLAKRSDADGDVEWIDPGQGGSVVWGGIGGNLANQTDLKNELDSIYASINALDDVVVHVSGNEEIYGQKTFNDKVFVKEIDGTEPAFLIVNLDGDNVGLNNSGFYFNASAPLWSADKALFFPELQQGDFKTIATTDQINNLQSQIDYVDNIVGDIETLLEAI